MKKILTIIVASVWSAASFAQVLPSLLVNSDPQAMGAAGISVLGSPAYALQGYAASTVFMEGTGSAGVSLAASARKASSSRTRSSVE